jgi:hypothetical protein
MLLGQILREQAAAMQVVEEHRADFEAELRAMHRVLLANESQV